MKSEKTSYFAPNQYIRLQDKYIGGDVVSGGQCQESCQIGGVAANVFVIVFVFVSVFVFVIVFFWSGCKMRIFGVMYSVGNARRVARLAEWL